ncbi:hypothetical protein [Caulobacter sp. RL271]|uniref:Uncharacterized protein n=1 Tax=Caulobacter segnis TaxID=88688 RepID=A0ABY4ZYI2_9CAUL|nr:hypothetical protein [Caulobacter segnis]USQ97259.1 hypothetical protein MZV50_06870 [Caulobacter segnis]
MKGPDNRSLRKRQNGAAFFAPIPVAIPAGMTDPDEKLLAAWSGQPTPTIGAGVPTVRAARRRLIELRRDRDVDR